MGDHFQPQPPPAANDKPAVWDLVVQDLERDEAPLSTLKAPFPWSTRDLMALVRADARARDAQGRKRYGVPLQAGNGRDAPVDAYQEALDLAVYLRQALEEHASRFVPDAELYVREHLSGLYNIALHSVWRLRWLLFSRDGR
ncbi:hypothetical protein [Corallococcus sp. EGB]|uniref:hypothetical protein n=1 Tax=Corallococcus sp. EGB TaxID=1521117 RepID=UPI001CBB8987|nr:hypothetical protein [Corallococcus sp. EGB]